jgi:hypothetical protein
MRKILFFLAFILFSIVLNAQGSWTLQSTNMSGTSTGVDQISAVDSNIVWINGFNGSSTGGRIKVFSRTQNGGTLWSGGTYTGFGATVYPQVLCGVTYNKAFAVAMDTATGGFASFWKTTDGGANWSLVTGVMNTGSTTFADGVLFWNSNTGFCYGDPVSNKFDIYYTVDGGTTWTPTLAANVAVPLSGEYGYNGYDCAAKMEGGYAAFITNMGRVYKTSNYGVNWSVTATAPFTAVANGKIYITGTNKMIVAGMATGATTYTWKQTTDGGTTWSVYTPTGSFYQYAITYVPYSANMLVSTSPYSGASGVSYSVDAGASWTNFTDALLQTTGVNNQCLGVGFADASHGWVGNYTTGTNSILKVVLSLPANAGNITGLTSVCQGQNAVTYTIAAVPNATSYIWTLPNGATGASTTNSISVNYGTAAVSGNITVKGHNSFGNGAVSTIAIIVNPTPIVTNKTTSVLTGGTFTVTPTGVPAGTTYTWPAPVYTGGVTGGSAQSTGVTSISQTLSIASGSGTAIYTVTPTSGNCSGNTFTVTVTVNSTCIPVAVTAQPTSSQTVCTPSTAVGFRVVASVGTTPITYQWQYNNGTAWVNVINGTPNGAIYTNGNTDTMTVAGITTAATYQYRCYLTNCSGANNATSNTANLIVNATPPSALVTQVANTLSSSASSGNQWYNLVSGAISNATSQTYTPLQTGDYYVVVTLNGCSSDSSNIFHFIFTGIENNGSSDISYNITPNPAKDYVYINTKGLKGKIKMEVMDVQGKLIFTDSFVASETDFSKKININNFERGVYFFRIHNDQFVKTEKIVVNY